MEHSNNFESLNRRNIWRLNQLTYLIVVFISRYWFDQLLLPLIWINEFVPTKLDRMETARVFDNMLFSSGRYGSFQRIVDLN